MSGSWKKIATFLAARKVWIATVATGHTFNAIFDFLFNYPLYFYLIETRGIAKGYLILTVLDLVICWFFIKFYDWLKRDWLGIEVAKEVKEHGPAFIKKINVESRTGHILWWPFSKIILFILWAVNKGGLVAFVALSIHTDPFITTVYMRKGCGEYNGLTRKDKLVFIVSGLVSNFYWTARTFGILALAKWSWSAIVN